MADENRSAGTGAENPENKRVLVHADHVKVYFKGKEKKANAVRAVDDVSFDIMKGETFGVVGESGCGKSTLGRTLIRLIPATAGHIYLDGEDISGLKGGALKQMRKKAQIIFQDPSACLNPRRTVRQILMEPFEIHHMTGKLDVNARIEELLHLVGLDTYHLTSQSSLDGTSEIASIFTMFLLHSFLSLGLCLLLRRSLYDVQTIDVQKAAARVSNPSATRGRYSPR